MKIKTFNIEYDTDNKKVKNLPKEIIFDMDVDEDFNPAYELADMISDQTGWCVSRFSFEIIEQ